ncbi:ligase-associated DNA damage response endonuclease PdeM [Roseivivax jejudonensis]|nr:ligase-associated DNA damage response endonuclease PdeM [Roseivivax jejudonensis]
MNRLVFDFCGATLEALGSGALHWPAARTLVVSDLHLGKCARGAATGGAALPPYDTRETLARLARDIAATEPERVICLGDSFDSVAIGAALPSEERARIAALQTGRDWIWIEGNHDPGHVGAGGTHLETWAQAPLAFRHITVPASDAGEVSGHYHPKARILLRGRALSRACFLMDSERLMLPAYGAYTGGLWTHSATLSRLMGPGAEVILCGERPARLPMPRAEARRA